MNKVIILLTGWLLVLSITSFKFDDTTNDVVSKKIEIADSLDTNNQIINKQGFILSYNELHEQPNWVFYKLFPSDLNCLDKATRKNKFKSDIDITTGSASLEDYKGSGYDRGHLKPSADETCNQDLMNETFLMSNMSPQHPSFNRGIWKSLESHVRDLVKDYDSLYVYTAGVLSNNLSTIGDNKVTVPNMYYKIVYVFNEGDIYTEAYLIPNKKSVEPYKYYATTISAIEDVTGIDFPGVSISFTIPK